MSIDWQKIRNNKKIEIPLIIILSIIAVLTINHSASVVKQQNELPFWARQMELIVKHNDQLIVDSKKQLETQLSYLSSKDLINRSEFELTNVSINDAKILKDCDKTIQDLKTYYFANAIIESKKFGNKRAGNKELKEFEDIVKKNKYIHDYDKVMKEIDDTFQVVAKDDVK